MNHGLLQRLRRELSSRGVFVEYRTDGDKWFAVLKGHSGWQQFQFAMTLIEPYLGTALIEKGGVLPDNKWEALLWLNPPMSEVLKREAKSIPTVSVGSDPAA